MASSKLEAELRSMIGGDDPGDLPSEGDLFGDLASPIAMQAEASGFDLGGRRGRPEGARGRASLDLVRFLKATRRPALLALHDVCDLTWGELARMLGCSKMEAAEFWRKCVAELLPYVERRQPMAVEVTPGGALVPVMVFGQEPVRPDLATGNPPIDGEFRPLAGPSAGQVSQAQSHAGPEPQPFQEDS